MKDHPGTFIALVAEVYCLQTFLAIEEALVFALLLKEIGWFIGGCNLLSDNDLSRDQNFPGLFLKLLSFSFSSHF
jgi:hypothetical protein